MDNISQWIFLIGLIVMEIIRFPHRRRNRLDMRKRRIQAMHAGRLDVTIDMLCFTGTHLIPLIYLFSPWLDYANYPLPGWAGWLGTVFMFAAIMLLWKAHADLGLNWSPTLQIVPEHKLVTNGIYAYIRHPFMLRSGWQRSPRLYCWRTGLLEQRHCYSLYPFTLPGCRKKSR